MNYTTVKIRAYADISGTVVDISKIYCTFALSELPTAVITVPLGLETGSGKISLGHFLGTNIYNLLPINVYITISNPSGKKILIPEGTYLIFSGYITGASYTRTSNKLELVLSAVHWLQTLAFSSAISATWLPSNPYDFNFSSLLEDVAGGGAVPASNLMPVLDINRMRDNFGNCLLDWLAQLASADRLKTENLAHLVNIDKIKKNDILTGINATILSSGIISLLELDANEDQLQLLHTNIRQALAGLLTRNQKDGLENFVASLASKTLWEFLLALSKLFLFEIVALPDVVYLVPYIGPYRQYYDTFGEGNSIALTDIVAYPTRFSYTPPISAVLIRANLDNLTGLAENPQGKILSTLSGAYVSNLTGMVMVRDAPPYLTSVITDQVIGANNATKPGNSGINPSPEEEVVEPAMERIFLDRYAHFIYANEITKGRQTTVACPFRLDICPGSSLKIQTAPDAYGFTGQFRYFYGSVESVKYNIDASTSTALALYNLTHVRSDIENESDDFTVEKHPFYSQGWLGTNIGTQNLRTEIPTIIQTMEAQS